MMKKHHSSKQSKSLKQSSGVISVDPADLYFTHSRIRPTFR